MRPRSKACSSARLPDELREALGLDGDEIAGPPPPRPQPARAASTSTAARRRWRCWRSSATHLVHIYGQHEQALLLRPAQSPRAARPLRRARQRAQRDGRRLCRLPRRARRAWSTLEQRPRSAGTNAASCSSSSIAELARRRRASGEEAELRRERELLRHAERAATGLPRGRSDALLRAGRDRRRPRPSRRPARRARRASRQPSLPPPSWSRRPRAARGGGAAAARRGRPARTPTRIGSRRSSRACSCWRA